MDRTELMPSEGYHVEWTWGRLKWWQRLINKVRPGTYNTMTYYVKYWKK